MYNRKLEQQKDFEKRYVVKSDVTPESFLASIY